MDVDDLLHRGFIRHERLGVFFTYCPVCRAGTYFEWWDAPRIDDGEFRRRETVACRECGTVDARDEDWIMSRYPVLNLHHARVE